MKQLHPATLVFTCSSVPSSRTSDFRMTRVNVAKSYESDNPIVNYCLQLTVKQHPLQTELHKATLTHPHGGMLGAPEVLQLGQNFLRAANAKKVLDIGTFTGASALAWALASAPDGHVDSFDVSHSALDSVGRPIINKDPAVALKITFHLGPALDGLDKLIAAGQTGTYDFAFIDADKGNYSNYYERVMKLLRPGGVILVDNALWDGKVVDPPETQSDSTKAIDAANKLIFNDPKSYSALLTYGDGVHLAFKA